MQIKLKTPTKKFTERYEQCNIYVKCFWHFTLLFVVRDKVLHEFYSPESHTYCLVAREALGVGESYREVI